MRVAPAGQDLVRIGLVADVPDQPVVRRVEDVVQGHGELDHAQAGAEMPAGHRDRVDRLLPQLGRQLHEAARGRGGAGRWARGPGRGAGSRSSTTELSGRAVQDLRLITKSNSSVRSVARPAKMSRRPTARAAQLGEHAAAPRLAQHADEGGLADLLVAAGILAGGDTLAAAVQQIVLDLEGEPEVVGVGARAPPRRRPARRPRMAPASQAKRIRAPVLSRCMAEMSASDQACFSAIRSSSWPPHMPSEPAATGQARRPASQRCSASAAVVRPRQHLEGQAAAARRRPGWRWPRRRRDGRPAGRGAAPHRPWPAGRHGPGSRRGSARSRRRRGWARHRRTPNSSAVAATRNGRSRLPPPSTA